MTKKRIPAWYKLFLERKIKKLERGLISLNFAEASLSFGYINETKIYINLAKQTLK